MSASTSYPSTQRSAGAKIIFAVAALAAVVMILAAIVAEAISRGVTLPVGGAGEPAACQAVTDASLPLRLQPAIQAQCRE